MNATVDDAGHPYSTIDTGKPQRGGDGYMFVVGFFCIFVLLIGFTYASYMCKKSRSPQQTTISFGTTVNNDDIENHHHHLMTFPGGLGDNVLVTFPMFLYSDAIMPHKDECSICLADYQPADVVRLLPECGHLFHVNCIDTWLKAHPTCPMCRNTPIAAMMPLWVQ